nr:hypothetical protein [Vibrio rotiferianus]
MQGTAKVVYIDERKRFQTHTFELQRWSIRLITVQFGLDGCSLTIGEVTDNRISVHLIPETLN